MGFYNVINRALLQQNQPEDISQVLANLDAIASVVNGGLDNNNISPTAAITASRLAGYPADAVKVLKGDGSWAPPGGVDYKNVWDVAFPYTQGDVVTYQGVTYVAVNPSTGQPPPAGGPQAWTLGRGLSLPASPVDGQEYILTDSLTAPTYNWWFRYNSGSSSTYKWEFVGGPALSGGPSGNITGTMTSPSDLTGAPLITVPRGGDYQIDWGCSFYANAPGAFFMYCAASPLSSSGAQGASGTQWTGASLASSGRVALGASTIVKLQVWQNIASSANYANGWLKVTPVRVS